MSHNTTGHATGSSTPGTSGTGTARASSAAEAAERTAAIALWVVVGLALVYGVGETAVRVAQLFT